MKNKIAAVVFLKNSNLRRKSWKKWMKGMKERVRNGRVVGTQEWFDGEPKARKELIQKKLQSWKN